MPLSTFLGRNTTRKSSCHLDFSATGCQTKRHQLDMQFLQTVHSCRGQELYTVKSFVDDKNTNTHDVSLSVVLAAADLVLQKALPSERKSAECGIQAVKAPLGRLRAPLSADAALRFRFP